jgi:hypothetical protein
MSAPRHLWSGDWRQESSAHAEALAARRARREQPAEDAGVAPPRRSIPPRRPAPPRRQAVARHATRAFLGHLRSLRLGNRARLRAAGLVVSLTLLSALGAYVLTSLVVRAIGGA